MINHDAAAKLIRENMETYWSLEEDNRIYEEIRNGHRGGVVCDTLHTASEVITRGIWANAGDEAVGVATKLIIRTVLAGVEYD